MNNIVYLPTPELLKNLTEFFREIEEAKKAAIYTYRILKEAIRKYVQKAIIRATRERLALSVFVSLFVGIVFSAPMIGGPIGAAIIRSPISIFLLEEEVEVLLACGYDLSKL